ncbi:helix-turn-helix domain-containing protein [Luteibacter sp. SG786]|uniref:GlxA family transcriptional regulator n=1 Tax=Luteibacter sp. SG786 TaxID=2587130 RepID=UPI001421DADF|nr:helix-turn-helix domain-containing protein [Luteibacter sp. SG786]NII55769.1 transcriptional regulator GlxA family with amidase domain [Luteibacter sp. SG786]
MRTPLSTVAILAPPGVQMLDVSGPADVFAEANRQSGREVYRVVTVGTAPLAIMASSGMRFLPDTTIRQEFERLDTLLVAGSPTLADAAVDLGVVAWLQRQAARSRRYGSICSGALLFARTGLLDGRRVTTHWKVAELLAERHPSLHVEADAFVVRDGAVCTAAGVTAGMDLAIALVEEDLGRDIAKAVAAELVVFYRRPGGQMQFSRHGESAPAGRSALQELQRYVASHPGENHSVATMAARVGLSPRHFARIFRQDVGMTPAEFVEAMRVDAARRLLEEDHETPKRVADRLGYANANGLRRAFLRRFGVTPADYRKRHSHARL